MEPLASTPAKVLTPVLVLPVGPVPTAKSGSPMSVPTTCVPMEVLAKARESTITLASAPWVSTEFIVN